FGYRNPPADGAAAAFFSFVSEKSGPASVTNGRPGHPTWQRRAMKGDCAMLRTMFPAVLAAARTAMLATRAAGAARRTSLGFHFTTKGRAAGAALRSEEHTSELQSREN